MKVDFHVGLKDLQPYNHIRPMVSYNLKKPCAFQISKMYDLVHAAYGLFNLLKVDMFMNPTNIEPAQAAANKSLIYTPEGEVLAEFHGIP